MKKLQCELCGSLEILKTADNLFQCQHCGCKYTLEQAKSLIVGTVVAVSPDFEIVAGEHTVEANKTKEPKSKSDAKINVNSLATLEIAITSFCKEFGGTTRSAELLAQYILAKLEDSVFKCGNWFVYDQKIEYEYEWGGHSFFDDGGGIEGIMQWSMTAIESTDKQIENVRIQNMMCYPQHDNHEESFVCENPFGLFGLFEISYLRKEEHTD